VDVYKFVQLTRTISVFLFLINNLLKNKLINVLYSRYRRLQHTTKRPLKGDKRQFIGRYLETNLACN